ncbi:MAG: type II 3-dehydroquinate dehydratase [Gammaproteobacteria bacterium]|nr:type II 3-dehydroquinate dehydratase [Gammaproteobacteria bacterium]
MAHILLLNGPNLNLLGLREPHHYGTLTLAQIEQQLAAAAAAAGLQLSTLQSNSEAVLIERVHQSWQLVDFILINPAAFTHTSIALRDALKGVAIPFIEIHLSNIHNREPFRQISYFSDIAQGVISGLGAIGYSLALQAAIAHLTQASSASESGHI